jgi:hypothetical protein
VNGLAIYAALVATAALAWNVVSWRLGTMTRVHVRIEATSLVMGFGPVENLTIVARNLSAHPVQAVAASFEVIGPPSRTVSLVPTPHPSESIPGVLPARSEGLRSMPREDAEDLGLVGVPIRASVQVAHRDEPYYSKSIVISADAWDDAPGAGLYHAGPLGQD